MPPEPNPSLAMQDPGRYVQERAVYEAAAIRVNQLLAQANEPKQVVQQLTQQQTNETLAREDAELRKHFPETATPEGRDKFFEAAFETGRQLGFSEEEMQGVGDHRTLRAIHYAKLGLAAEQAKKKAMQKVTAAPAPTTPKPKAQGPNVQQVRKNQDAMQRLGKTGSMKDALSIDFE
jgi:pyruvate/2-oxoglutarate dehydrogenase complex dihydrolipoamide acyltransferase (E2) component